MNSSHGFARSSCRAVRSLAGLVVVSSLTAGVGCGDSIDQPKPPGLSPVVGAGGGAAVGVPGGGGTPITPPNAGGVSAAGGTPVTSSTGGAPAGGAPAGGAPAGGAPAGGAPAGGAPNVGGSAGQPTPSGDLSVFKDPGKSPWQVVPEGEVAAKCKLDPSKLAGVTLGSGFAIIRYGQMCYRKPATDGATAMWSATKTLGATVTGIASYETRDIPRTGPKTGQLKDTDKATYWLDTVTYNREAYVAHVLSMEAHNASLAYGSKKHSYDTVGSVQINTLGTMINRAISQDSMRLGTTTAALAKTFLFDEIGMTQSTWPGTVFAYSWSATLGDMARLGNLLIHQGVWSGKRILGADWVYKQTHPAFEDGNTAYGYLTWLVAKEGQTSIGGGSFTGGAGATAGGLLADDCGPSALWQRYPHGFLSEAKDCTYTMNSCKQKYDVGLWSAQGLGGQFIVGHPGLDLVIVAKDYSGGGGPTGLWKAIRPALVALDPTYKGDEAAFCKAYAAGDYAPDLPAPIVQPPDEPKM
jgi:hypothetical protein